MSFAPALSVPARGVTLTGRPCSIRRPTPRPSAWQAVEPGGSSSRTMTMCLTVTGSFARPMPLTLRQA